MQCCNQIKEVYGFGSVLLAAFNSCHDNYETTVQILSAQFNPRTSLLMLGTQAPPLSRTGLLSLYTFSRNSTLDAHFSDEGQTGSVL